ncbi:MAG: hypothetical protein EOP24_43580 [Hyphomicrobiales bacterium]|nr:MAG: hypothetical protein EOP24_43580 [Hyphomicrobiales bacterium]
MVDVDPFGTQRDASGIPAELVSAGFDNAEEIGRGGFGVVYRCTQTSLDRSVAVKVLTSDLDAENRERFFREERAMGLLTGHPNIVDALQVGVTDSGRPYIVMQYHPHGSLNARIQRHGPLSLEDALTLGVKLAGALETAHRIGILHRDVKPSNILLTEYGEPKLTDFGIAHITGAFETATGIVTGSPAFTAPEVLKGSSPSVASDVYGLGATLFSALTGHAAFERRSGEQLVTLFVRITTQSIPDLKEQGLAPDITSIVERAMATQPSDRQPTAAALGEELREAQLHHGLPADQMALHAEPDKRNGLFSGYHSLESRGQRLSRPHPHKGGKGNLPVELTSFVGRRRELTEIKEMLAASHLVTLIGPGGVGKTRMSLRAATTVKRNFTDGVWLVELGELQNESSLMDVLAASLDVRDQSGRPLREVLLEHLTPLDLLLVLDNCEQLIAAVADLSEELLQTCPRLRILATSREPLAIGGEITLTVPPLTTPDPETQCTLEGLPLYDAVTLFRARAAAVVPSFTLSEDNKVAVARICHRLDGLPLSIELAAARIRVMSPEQILQRLDDRYTLLTRGRRGAPLETSSTPRTRSSTTSSWTSRGSPSLPFFRLDRLDRHLVGSPAPMPTTKSSRMCAGYRSCMLEESLDPQTTHGRRSRLNWSA